LVITQCNTTVRPFVTGSHESRWDHVPGESSIAQWLSFVQLCCSISKVACLVLKPVNSLLQSCNVFILPQKVVLY
jgi:hypothetical protein